jgi:hypothetical protein
MQDVVKRALAISQTSASLSKLVRKNMADRSIWLDSYLNGESVQDVLGAMLPNDIDTDDRRAFAEVGRENDNREQH